MKLRVLALLTATIYLLCACGNTVSDQQFDFFPDLSEPEPQQEINSGEVVTQVSLAYNVNDSLNPYKMVTQQNQELIPLLYDSLVVVNKQLEPKNQLADTITQSGYEYTVKLKQVQMSDGEVITPADVVYSAKLAMNAGGKWSEQLSNLSDVKAGDGEVIFALHTPDAGFASLLTFPVIKDGTGEMDFPIGVSRYYLSGTWGTTGGSLIANHLYYGDASTVENIKLVHVTDPDGLLFNIKSGDLDVIYSDLSSTKFSELASNGTPVPLTNLVYIGVNANRGLLGRAEFRAAVSKALNRDELVSKAYVSRADAAMYPFHPSFYQMKDVDVSAPRNLTEADALLNELGLTDRDGDGYRMYNGQAITLSLLVNSENTYRNAAATLITEQLRQIGVRVEVVSKPSQECQQTIGNNQYDLYIGEVRLKENMDISILLRGGALGTSAAYDEALMQAYQQYRSSGEGIESFCSQFTAQSPFIPLVYRQGMVFHNRNFQSGMIATQQNIFYNIDEW